MLKRQRKGVAQAGQREWIGGVVALPLEIERDGPVSISLWVELPGHVVLAHHLAGGRNGSQGAQTSLDEAMQRPLVGAPRLPTRVRVATEALATMARTRLPASVPVVVAATPEIDAIAGDLLGHLGRAGRTAYLTNEALSQPMLREIFAAAARLARTEFWNLLSERDVLRIDIPALGVRGGALMAIGRAGMARALLIFPSARHVAMYEAAAVLMHELGDEGVRDLGSPILSVSFDEAAELSSEALRVIKHSGFALASEASVPVLEQRNQQGELEDVTESHAQVATTCMTVLAQAIEKHARAKTKAIPTTFTERALVDAGFEAVLSRPHDDFVRVTEGLRAVAEAAAQNVKVGRNDPCPCGNGKKYKKCCQGSTQPGARLVDAQALSSMRGHDFDHRLIPQLEAFADRELHGRHRDADRMFQDAAAAAQLAGPLRYYAQVIDGKVVAQHFLDRHESRLSDGERSWLEAQLDAYLTVLEVVQVERESRIRLRDVYTDVERTVTERSASQGLHRREMLLGRVLDHGGESWLVGVHPRTLTPLQAGEVLLRISEAMKKVVGKTRAKTVRVPEELLVSVWERVVAQADEAVHNRTLTNADGERLSFVTDHFDFEPSARTEVEARIKNIPWCAEPELEGGLTAFPFMRPGRVTRQTSDTLYGRVLVGELRLRIETNSAARADILRSRLEGICGALLTHRLREHQDPTSTAQREGPKTAPRPPSSIPPEVREALRAHKQRLLEDWLDQPIPALKDRTPRQAARTKAGKSQVDLLLRDMELMQARFSDGIETDFARLRMALGL